MATISRKIYLAKKTRVEPIHIVQDSQVPIALEFMDYAIPAGATVRAYATGRYSGATYTASCAVSGNTVTLTAPEGFFVYGGNLLQVEVNGQIIPFAIDVGCEVRLSEGGQGATPEAVRPLVERAEAAAQSASASETNAAASATKAADSLSATIQNASAAKTSAENAAERLREATKASSDAAGYAGQAQQFANTAAGYAGAATVSIGWDADGYFSIFEQEE